MATTLEYTPPEYNYSSLDLDCFRAALWFGVISILGAHLKCRKRFVISYNSNEWFVCDTLISGSIPFRAHFVFVLCFPCIYCCMLCSVRMHTKRASSPCLSLRFLLNFMNSIAKEMDRVTSKRFKITQMTKYMHLKKIHEIQRNFQNTKSFDLMGSSVYETKIIKISCFLSS